MEITKDRLSASIRNSKEKVVCAFQLAIFQECSSFFLAHTRASVKYTGINLATEQTAATTKLYHPLRRWNKKNKMTRKAY